MYHKTKIKTIIVATLFILLNSYIFISSVNLTHADTLSTIDTFGFVSAIPNPVGVNQQMVITFLIDKVNPTATIDANHFTGINVTITKPDNTTEIKTGLSTDSTSTGYFLYTPTQIGTYYFQMSFAGQWANSSIGDFVGFNPVTENTYRWYEPSTSTNTPVLVQEEPIEILPYNPISTEYWTTPINSENKGWTQHLDNWLMEGYDFTPRSFDGQMAFSPYTAAAESAHVMWTEPITFGGLVSAELGDSSYYTGLTYEQFYTPLILSGRIIYNDHGPTASGTGFTGPIDTFGARCLDLYTGEEIWYLENTTITFAQTLMINNPNEHGAHPYLWSVSQTETEWFMHDAWTGRKIVTVANATPGYTVFGPSGEVLSYTLDFSENTLTMWNSSKCIYGSTQFTLPSFMFGPEKIWSPSVGLIADWDDGIEWSVTIPAFNGFTENAISAINIDENVVLVAPDMLYPNNQPEYPPTLTFAAYPANLQKSDGAYPISIEPLWVNNVTDIFGYFNPHYNINEGMFSLFDNAEQKIHTYDAQTGNEISLTDSISTTGSLWTAFSVTGMAYGRTYMWGYDGHVRCFDGQTGEALWDYALPSSGLETSTGTYPIYAGCTIADNKVFFSNDEHSPDSTMWRGSKLYCLDAHKGEELWNVTGYYHYQTISNGYVTAINSYDQTIYTFGRGPSSTTVTAPDNGITLGSSLLIKGTVIDISSGTKQPEQAARFPNGVPAVSDESMSEWMGYVYLQKPRPNDVTGVQVKLEAIDPNGNFQNLGKTTTDAFGNYAFMYEPEVSGQYMIIASFQGSDSYYGSMSSTYFGVDPAPTTATPIQPEESPEPRKPAETSPITTERVIIAILAVTAVIGIAAYVLLKRK